LYGERTGLAVPPIPSAMWAGINAVLASRFPGLAGFFRYFGNQLLTDP